MNRPQSSLIVPNPVQNPAGSAICLRSEASARQAGDPYGYQTRPQVGRVSPLVAPEQREGGCAPRLPTSLQKFCLNAAGIPSLVARFAFRSLRANRSHPCHPDIAPRSRRARRISFHASKKQAVCGPWSVVHGPNVASLLPVFLPLWGAQSSLVGRKSRFISAHLIPAAEC